MNTGVTTEEVNLLTSVKHAEGSDIGMRREENQDSFGIVENESFRFFIVADGMGGVKGGAIASQLAVKTVTEYLQSRVGISDQDICSAIHTANQ